MSTVNKIDTEQNIATVPKKKPRKKRRTKKEMEEAQKLKEEKKLEKMKQLAAAALKKPAEKPRKKRRSKKEMEEARKLEAEKKAEKLKQKNGENEDGEGGEEAVDQQTTDADGKPKRRRKRNIEILEMPVLVYEMAKVEHLHVKPFIVCLPPHPKLAELDEDGEFMSSISKQIYELFRSYNGRITKNCLVNPELMNKIVLNSLYGEETDVLLVCFIKEYNQSTHSLALVLQNKDTTCIDDYTKSNPLFKNGKVEYKLRACLYLDDDIVHLGLRGKQEDRDEEEIAAMKSRID